MIPEIPQAAGPVLTRTLYSDKKIKMENKTFKFKTNINCGGCVAAVKTQLDNAEGVCEWSVDIADKRKLLTVTSGGITETQVMELVKKKGFNIDFVND
jgi:copper chaperone